MSCEECELAQSEGMVAPYRWGIANVDVVGCRTHVKEIFDVLNARQSVGPGGGVDAKYGHLHIQGVPQDEPVFILRAQDAHAIYVIEEYKRLAASHNTEMAHSLQLTLDRFRAWPVRKLPD